MQTPLLITSATYVSKNPDLVSITFSDGTNTRLYLDCGFPRYSANDMLDAWLADGNQISDP